MTGLVRRCSLGLALWLAFGAGEIQGRGIYPKGTPLVLLGLAALLVAGNHAANSLTRTERRRHRSTRGQVRRLERDLADAVGESQTWKARFFTLREGRALDRLELRFLRMDVASLRRQVDPTEGVRS